MVDTVPENDGHRPAPLPRPTADTPGPARRLAEHLGNIVRAATAGDAGTAWESALPCRRRPANRRLPGSDDRAAHRVRGADPMAVQRLRRRRSDQQLGGLAVRSAPPRADRRRAPPTRSSSPTRSRQRCAICSCWTPTANDSCSASAPTHDGAVLAATDDDLDELIGAVAAEANHEPNRRRQQRLDAAFDALNTAARLQRLVIRWPYPSWTSHECSAGAPRGCPSTPATKSASNARSPRDTSPSSSGAPPGARTSGRNGPASRSPDCATPPPTSPGPCTGATATSASTSTTYCAPSNRVDDLLTEIDRDPTCIFWG